ncbi:hypothetical protein HYX17_01685 [Candidatus Woesearchaeota archaeon]|nr:hypothetical protein [Candidatus Woesearchaeota archaeon]
MAKIKKHPTKKWEISFIELEDDKIKRFKVTKRVPDLLVAETKFFKSKKRAKKQFDEWLK